MTSTWNFTEVRNKWEGLSGALSKLDDSVIAKASTLPSINQFSEDGDFRNLMNALRLMKNEMSSLSDEIQSQAGGLESDVKQFYDIARDYQSEIDIFKKGRDQAFGLYDDLSNQHRKLLTEFEVLKAEYNSVNDQVESSKSISAVCEEAVSKAKEVNEILIGDLSSLKVELAGTKKRLEILTSENDRLNSIKENEDFDRSALMEQLSKEIKSRDNALMLADAARNELSRLLGESEQDRLAREAAQHDREEAVDAVEGLNSIIEELKTQ